jgi:hypothetical protein
MAQRWLYQLSTEILAEALQVGDDRAGEPSPRELAMELAKLWREILTGTAVIFCDSLDPAKQYGASWQKKLKEARSEVLTIRRRDGVQATHLEAIHEGMAQLAHTVGSCPKAISEYPRCELRVTAAKVDVTLCCTYLVLGK